MLERVALGLDGADPGTDLRQGGREPVTLLVGGSERTLQGVDLGPARRRLLARAAPQVLDLSAVVVRGPERCLGVVELPLARREFLDRPGDRLLDARELRGDGIETGGAGGMPRQRLASDGLAVDGRTVPTVGVLAFTPRLAEPLFRGGESVRRRRSGIGRREDLAVERVEALASQLAVPRGRGPSRPSDARARAAARAGGPPRASC